MGLYISIVSYRRELCREKGYKIIKKAFLLKRKENLCWIYSPTQPDAHSMCLFYCPEAIRFNFFSAELLLSTVPRDSIHNSIYL